MTIANDNPCLSCNTNQHCCSKVSGLLLSEDEFARHFSCHESRLSVRRAGKLVIVSVNDDGPCPHWRKEGCRIYGERPIDCRVFPYIPTHVIDRGTRGIKIVFHSRSDCPRKEHLFPLMPMAEVKALLVALGRKLYGETRIIVIRHEQGIISRLLNRIEAAVYRRIQ